MNWSWEQFLIKCLCDHSEQSEQNPFKYQKLLGQFQLNDFVIIVNKVNKTLSNIQSSWEQFITK